MNKETQTERVTKYLYINGATDNKTIAKDLDIITHNVRRITGTETHKGNFKRVSKGVHQIVYEPIREHSRKPDCVRDRIIKLCGDLPRIELFARQRVKGWDSWGNEV